MESERFLDEYTTTPKQGLILAQGFRRRNKGLIALMFGLLMAVPGIYLGTAMVAAEVNPEFTYETIQSSSGFLDDASMAFDSQGRSHIAYSDEGTGLWYGIDSATGWQLELVDLVETGNAVWYMSLALDSQDHAYLAYSDYSGMTSNLVLATNAGGTWTRQVLRDGAENDAYFGDGVSMAIDSQGHIHMAYGFISRPSYDEILEYATNEGGSWEFTNFTEIGDISGDFGVSLAVDSQDNCHIVCRDVIQNVIYLTDSSGSWEWSYIWEVATYGWTISLSMDGLGGIHVCFPIADYNTSTMQNEYSVIHGVKTEASWSFETVFTVVEQIDYVSIAADMSGSAHIISRTLGVENAVFYSTNEGGSWNTGLLDNRTTAAFVLRAFVGPDGLHGLYSVFDTDQVTQLLVHAFRPLIPPEPIAWEVSIAGLSGEYYLSGVSHTIIITILDQFGNVFPDYSGTVHFATNRTGEATLPADHAFRTNDNGVHTFTVTFTANGYFSLTCQDTVNAKLGETRSGIRVLPSPPAPSTLILSAPSVASIGTPFTVAVTVLDQYGAQHKSYTGTIHFSTDAQPGDYTLPSEYSFTPLDEGLHVFTGGASFNSNGNWTITARDLANASISGQVQLIVLEGPAISFRMYDMFETPWREWWEWRYNYENDVILSNEPHKYTLLYDRQMLGMSGIIYAPYRWNVTAENLTTIDVDNPEFMPVFGPKDVIGAQAKMTLHWDYINDTWFDDYWASKWGNDPYWDPYNDILIREGQHSDGYTLGVVYTIDMNREAALTWLNLSSTEADVASWWTDNRDAYQSAWDSWLDNEGNNRLDIYYGYDDMLYQLGTMSDLTELPNGDVRLEIGHFSWGFEVLQTRWLTEAKICSTEPYMEDFTLSADYFTGYADLTYDAVCQWSLHAVRANGTEEGAAWAWEPKLIDYVGGAGSDYTPYESLTYTDWNAGDPNWGYGLGDWTYYDYTPGYFNLTSSDSFTIELPKQPDVVGYKGVSTWADPFAGESSIINATMGDLADFDAITVFGDMTLGFYETGGVDLGSMYDAEGKVLTIQGPQSFDGSHHWSGGPLYHGAPWIEFDIVRLPSRMDHLELWADNFAFSGRPSTFTLLAMDQYGDPFPNYTGTVGFDSSDPLAVLPGEYTFGPSDGGMKDFNFTLNTLGSQNLTVADVANPDLFTSADVFVYTPPKAAYIVIGHYDPAIQGRPMTIEVAVMDQYQNVFSDYRGTIAFSSDDPGAVLPEDYTFTEGDMGVHWFGGIYLNSGDHMIAAIDVADPMVNGTGWISVSPEYPPFISLLGPRWVYQGDSLTFNAQVIDMNGDSVKITWDFGDGSPLTVGNPVDHTYTTLGVFDYAVYADDGFGNNVSAGNSVTVSSGPGLLRVTTNPAVPSIIYLDGEWMSAWGADWVEVAPGEHTLSFGDVIGYIAPPAQTIAIASGEVTTVQGDFEQMGLLRVQTNLAGVTGTSAPTIYVDGLPRNDVSVNAYVAAGTYIVSFGAVKGYDPPSDTSVVVDPGQETTVTGLYFANQSAPGPVLDTFGYLRVQTSPALPSMISVDGEWMNMWGLDWVRLSPGTHVVTCSDVKGRITPPPMTVQVIAGQITTCTMTFGSTGSLVVKTDRPVPSTIYVNNVPRATWGLWLDVTPGTYTVSFGDIHGWLTPAPKTVIVNALQKTTVTGLFVPDTPSVSVSRSAITNGHSFTVDSCSETGVPWDDIAIALTDGTNYAMWYADDASLTEAMHNYSARPLGGIDVCLEVYDVLANGALNASDSIRLFTYGGAPGFDPLTNYTLGFYYLPTEQWMGPLIRFTG